MKKLEDFLDMYYRFISDEYTTTKNVPNVMYGPARIRFVTLHN